ncbi:MAG: glycosyltransferase [Bacteroidota bacterium]
MLSVLIPIYNYNAFPLVKEVHKQCLDCTITFEIICFDDGSGSYMEENQQILELSFCHIERLPNNVGRRKIRSKLARAATFDWLLFLDADVFPVKSDFMEQYVNAIGDDTDVIYGGLAYTTEEPPVDYVLRWQYGRQREAIGIEKRQKRWYETVLFSNILLKKNVFSAIEGSEYPLGYGYEDLVFGTALRNMKARVEHVQNEVYHLHTDTSEAFIEKTERSLHSLKFLVEHAIVAKDATRLLQTYYYLKNIKMERLIRWCFRKLKGRFRQNLLSGTPSLFIFDIYKLGYFCTIDLKE